MDLRSLLVRRDGKSQQGQKQSGESCPAFAWLSTLRSGLALFVIISIVGCTQGCTERGLATNDQASAEDSPSEEVVRFASGKNSLAGTLVVPPGSARGGSGRYPAVVLFH